MGSKTVLVFVLCMLLGLFCPGCKRNLSSNQQSVDAIVALRKLQAKVDTGLDYRDYRAALGDANFSVESFLDSPDAKAHPDFTADLSDSMKWYKAAAEIWQRQIAINDYYGFCDIDKLMTADPHTEASYYLEKDMSGLCKSYPELVRSIISGFGHADGLIFTVGEWDC